MGGLPVCSVNCDRPFTLRTWSAWAVVSADCRYWKVSAMYATPACIRGCYDLAGIGVWALGHEAAIGHGVLCTDPKENSQGWVLKIYSMRSPNTQYTPVPGHCSAALTHGHLAHTEVMQWALVVEASALTGFSHQPLHPQSLLLLF